MFFFLFSTVFASPISEALRTYDCARALAVTPPPEEFHFRMALGNCLAKQGQHEEALLYYDSPPVDLAPYAHLLKAHSLYSTKNYKNAQVILKDAIDGAQKQLLEAKILMKLGERRTARKKLNLLLTKKRSKQGFRPEHGDIDSAEIRWLLAQSAIEQGRITSAIPVLYKIWTHNPTSSYSQQSEQLLTELKELLPDPTTEKGTQYIRTRISTLKKMRLYKEANTYLSLLPATTQTKSSSAYSAFQAREYPEAIKRYDVQKTTSGSDLFHLAVALSRTDDYPRAAKVYKKLYTTYPKHKKAILSSFKVPYLSFDKGNYEEAIPLFREHIKRYPSTWFLTWSLIKLNKNKDALAEIDKLIRSYPKSKYAPYALHWKAMIQKELGEEYAGTLTNVLRSYPTNGQAWFSLRESQTKLPSQEQLILPPIPKSLDIPAYHTGNTLAEAGFSLWAQKKLRTLLPLAKDKTAKLLLAHSFVNAGDFQKAMALAKPYCVKPWKQGNPLAQQACYPRPFSGTISTQLKGSQIPKLLPYAIMKAESAMKPQVRSVADARGLMQLMPFVGEAHHKKLLPDTPYDPDFLFIAGYNARLGTAELKRLEQRFSEQPVTHPLPLIIAGYNGGPEAVERWMKLYTHQPVLAEEFAEDVGYTETRKYVKRVLGYLMEYQYIYGSGD
jgi:soluble lytic murein transglycosylase-like protein/TolA-binding protein